jgi:hydroxymethylbilane synthase
MAQAHLAAAALDAIGASVEVLGFSTRGDEISRRRPGGRWVEVDGQFTRDLERRLLEGQIDVAVHSFKDLPTAEVPGLTIGAVLPRADSRDCLITAAGETIDDLRFGARIGTSSPRRAAQLAARRIDFVAIPMRGNVDTRLERLRRGELDGVILAAAGLDRLGVPVEDAARLPFEIMLPAPAQGALALQARSDDTHLLSTLAKLDHGPTRVAVEAERRLLRQLGGGCLAPLGTLGEVDGDRLILRAAFEDDTGQLRRAEAAGATSDVDTVVLRVATAIRAGAAA